MHVAFIVEGVERELDVASGHGTVGDLAAALRRDAPGNDLMVDGVAGLFQAARRD